MLYYEGLLVNSVTYGLSKKPCYIYGREFYVIDGWCLLNPRVKYGFNLINTLQIIHC